MQLPQKIKSAPNRRVSSIFALLCMAMIAAASTGCAPLHSAASTAGNLPGAATSAGQYQLKMEMPFGKSQTYIGDIDGPLTIQNALERSGALKKYRSMQVDMFRKVEGAYAPLKMSAVFVPGKKMISPETDYGLRAGDSILVQSKSENSISNILGKLSQ